MGARGDRLSLQHRLQQRRNCNCNCTQACPRVPTAQGRAAGRRLWGQMTGGGVGVGAAGCARGSCLCLAALPPHWPEPPTSAYLRKGHSANKRFFYFSVALSDRQEVFWRRVLWAKTGRRACCNMACVPASPFTPHSVPCTHITPKGTTSTHAMCTPCYLRCAGNGARAAGKGGGRVG